MNTALQYVYNTQHNYLPQYVLDEFRGIAIGVCAGQPSDAACDVDKLTQTTAHVNMLPELIKMQCSMMGAWGDATADGGLVQMRTLDFGEGPFANVSTMLVHHPTESSSNPFVNVGFPGFVGAVTGWSSKIGMSEKLWLVSGAKGTQPGTYKGTADAIVIREMLETAPDTQGAIDIARAANRTWAIFLGVGDFSGNFDVLGYRNSDLSVHDDVSLPNVTGAPMIEHVAYVDKHPQPSKDSTLPTALQSIRGKITAEYIASNIPRVTESGDVHIGVYDFHAQQAYVSFGRTLANGSYPVDGYAYARPFLKFDMQALWNVKPAH